MVGEAIPLATHASAVPFERSARRHPEPFGPRGAGSKTGSGDARHLIARAHRDAGRLEIDDRTAVDTVIYPGDGTAR